MPQGEHKRFVGLGGKSIEVLAALETDLASGRFPVGSRLPSELELCERFGASRPTVRRAVARLTQEGFIEVRHRRGMFVARVTEPRRRSSTVAVMYVYEGGALERLQNLLLARDHLLCAYAQNQAAWRPENERAFLRRVLKEEYRGLVAFCSPQPPLNEDVLEELAAAGVRVIHIEPYTQGLPEQSHICPDYRQAGHDAAVHLLLGGYRDVRYLSLDLSPYERLLEEGFAHALQQHGTGYRRDQHFFRFDPAAAYSAEARAKLLEFLRGLRPPAGLFCCCTGHAETIHALAATAGLAVPEQLGLVGLDMNPDNASQPSVDSLEVDHLAMVAEAVAAITAPTWCEVRKLVPSRLVRRGTVGVKQGV